MPLPLPIGISAADALEYARKVGLPIPSQASPQPRGGLAAPLPPAARPWALDDPSEPGAERFAHGLGLGALASTPSPGTDREPHEATMEGGLLGALTAPSPALLSPAPPAGRASSQGDRAVSPPPGLPPAPAAAPGVPNPDIPTPLAAPQPRGGLASSGPPRPDPESILPQLTEPNPWMGYQKREGLERDLMRGMGLPVPTAEGSAAEAKAKQQAEFAARKARALAAPAGAGLVPDLNQLRDYAQVGLEETEPPDFLKPVGNIRVLAGTYPEQRVPVYGDDYYKAQQPGSPQEQEVSRQVAARQALVAALHGMGDLTKIQEAKLHVQAQRELANKQFIEHQVAGSPDITAAELAANVKSVRAAQKLGADAEPGLAGPATPVGVPDQPAATVPAPKKKATAEEELQQARDEAAKLRAATPTKDALDRFRGRVQGYTSIDDLLADAAGEPIVMGHPPARAQITKDLQSQGKAGIKDLDFELAKALVRYGNGAHTDEALGGVPVRHELVDQGFFLPKLHRYTVDSPLGEQSFSHLNVPGGAKLAGLGPISPLSSRAQQSSNRKRAEAAGALLRALAQQRQGGTP